MIDRLSVSELGLVVTEVGSDMPQTAAKIRDDKSLQRMLRFQPYLFMPKAEDEPKARSPN